MLSGLLAELEHHPALAGLLPTRPSAAVVRGGPSARRSAVFVFDPDRRTPVAFVKLTRDCEMRVRLRQEHATLEVVAALPELGGTVPTPLALLELDGATVSVQSSLPGGSLAALTRRGLSARATRRQLAAAVRWLELFQASTAAGHLPLVDAAAFRDRLDASLSSAAPPPVCRRLAEDADVLAEVTVPTVRGHGDFWPGNVLVNGATVGVVDWEHSADGAVPTTDLFMVLSAHAFLTPGRRLAARTRASGVAAAWRSSSRISAVYRDEAAGFLRRLGVADAPLDVLVVDFLLRMVESPPFGSPDDWRMALAEVVADLPGRSGPAGRGTRG